MLRRPAGDGRDPVRAAGGLPVADGSARSGPVVRAAYRWYRTWAGDGTWDAIHDGLRAQVRAAAGRDPQPSAAVLDAQSIKSSEGGEARGFDAGKKTTGPQTPPGCGHVGAAAGRDGHLGDGAGPPGWARDPRAPRRALLHRRPGLGRRRLRKQDRFQPAELGKGETRAADRDRQAHRRRQGLPGAAPTLGRGAHVRLAGAQPASGPRLRGV